MVHLCVRKVPCQPKSRDLAHILQASYQHTPNLCVLRGKPPPSECFGKSESYTRSRRGHAHIQTYYTLPEARNDCFACRQLDEASGPPSGFFGYHGTRCLAFGGYSGEAKLADTASGDLSRPHLGRAHRAVGSASENGYGDLLLRWSYIGRVSFFM